MHDQIMQNDNPRITTRNRKYIAMQFVVIAEVVNNNVESLELP